MKTSAIKNFTKIVAATMSAVFAFTLVPMALGQNAVVAAEAITKDQSNTSLGVSGIKGPKSGDETSAWTGSYVYFGKCDTNGDNEKDPIRFRVLAPSTKAYSDENGGPTLFLDSDETLFNMPFDDASNQWASDDCDLRTYLNGVFINPDNGYFTASEVSAIATSKGIGGDYSYTDPSFGATFYGAPVSVNDKIFLLDATEVMNPAYGYSSDCGIYTASDWTWNAYLEGYWGFNEVANHIKGGSSDFWWLRSACSSSSGDGCGVRNIGNMGYGNVSIDSVGVAPALNINQSSIIFSTKIKDIGNDFGEYKLTIMDENLNIAVPAGQYVTASGTTITVPYEVSGKDVRTATRATIFITDKAWNESDANIILYDELGASTASSGTFTLPSGRDLSGWGTDYHVYILAEVINGEKATDYASEPVEIMPQTYTVTYTVANGTWSDGSTADITETVIKDCLPKSIPTGMSASEGYEGGSWDTDPSTATISADTTFTYTFDAIPTYTVTVQNDGNGTATADVTSGPEGTEVTLTATPSSGYLFKEWQVVSGGVIVTDNKFTIGTSDVTVKAVFEAKPADPVEPTSVEPVNPTTVDPVTPAEPAAVEPPKSTGPFTYTVVGGGDTTWTEGDPDLVVKVTSDENGDHSFDRYEYTAIDGTKLTDEQAPATSGSTVITIKSDLLKTLSEGKHTILINFSDNSITTTVTIVKKAAGTTDVPSTGEMIGLTAIAGTVMILSACSMLILMRNKKREDEQ